MEIDCDALRWNIAQIRGQTGVARRLMAVVKADAYGHGALTVSEVALASGADCLGVATLEEGAQLRSGGVSAPIVILGAVNTAAEMQALQHWRLEPTLSTPEQLRTCSEHLDRPHPVHLKIDTGMSRLGAPWAEALDFVRLALSLPRLQVASLYSHLATADELDSEALHTQHHRFKTVLDTLKAAGLYLPCIHLANSAALMSCGQFRYDLVRAGVALYGLYPGEAFKNLLALRPVMQVRARVTQVRAVEAGTGVSYGHRFSTCTPSLLATVAIGYADGVARNLSGQIEVLLHGQRVPQVGVITMDQLVLDVTSLPQVQPGDVVTLLGSDGADYIGAEEWATKLGTISYEIVCGFKHRLPRVVYPKGDDRNTPGC